MITRTAANTALTGNGGFRNNSHRPVRYSAAAPGDRINPGIYITYFNFNPNRHRQSADGTQNPATASMPFVSSNFF